MHLPTFLSTTLLLLLVAGPSHLASATVDSHANLIKVPASYAARAARLQQPQHIFQTVVQDLIRGVSQTLSAQGGRSTPKLNTPSSASDETSSSSSGNKNEPCTKVTEDACGDPSYTPPKPNDARPLNKLPNARPKKSERRFISKLVEAEIKRLAAKIQDPALKRIWEK